ncbi:MAG TPA: PPOX class F420-dependent oxidoreductase [Chloroflexota bacterium]|nr:PPOX class F420-dependent oxidoreductase [Chloroflexota bacterium]
MALTPGLIGLLKEAAFGQLATLMPDGSPQVTHVWLDTDGEHILINTGSDHQKAKNVKRDPRVAVNVHDARAVRIAHVRGRVIEVISDGADQHIDELAKKYLGADRYPWRRPGEKRIIIKVRPESIHAIGVDGDQWPLPESAPSAGA